jgi:glyoxylase-like metal-dependent hydrolase (beta-lactamase superfamily II)/ferredoxin
MKDRRLEANTEGNYYVTSACINCDTCRQLAPQVFNEQNGYSAVKQQPHSRDEQQKTLHALLACPTGAIKGEAIINIKEAIAEFPLPIDGPVFYCGFTSPKSYGASSYYIQQEGGGLMIDAPRFYPALVERLLVMGGVKTVLLTHSDDVADAEQYARFFGAKRLIHEAERHAQPNA